MAGQQQQSGLPVHRQKLSSTLDLRHAFTTLRRETDHAPAEIISERGSYFDSDTDEDGCASECSGQEAVTDEQVFQEKMAGTRHLGINSDRQSELPRMEPSPDSNSVPVEERVHLDSGDCHRLQPDWEDRLPRHGREIDKMIAFSFEAFPIRSSEAQGSQRNRNVVGQRLGEPFVFQMDGTCSSDDNTEDTDAEEHLSLERDASGSEARLAACEVIQEWRGLQISDSGQHSDISGEGAIPRPVPTRAVEKVEQLQGRSHS